jgi:hypothetical protein
MSTFSEERFVGVSEAEPSTPRWQISLWHFRCLRMGKIDVITYKYVINIDYYMAFFISYPLSALGHDISQRADSQFLELHCYMVLIITDNNLLSINYIYHILVDNIAKILPCDKTLSFV